MPRRCLSLIALGAVALVACGDDLEGVARHQRFGVFRDLVLVARSDAKGGPFFLDRFEVSRREVLHWLAETGRVVPEAWPETWSTADQDAPAQQRPAVRIDLPTARAFAAWRLCRLPTAAEWEYTVTGGGAYRFPWGDHGRAEWANTPELSLGQSAAIGTFESGRSPGGPYDLVGNVAEWTESVPAGFLRELSACPDFASLQVWAVGPGWPRPLLATVVSAWQPPPRLVVGGAYIGVSDSSSMRTTRSSSAMLACQPQEWSDTTGMRVAIDPRGLLVALLREPLLPSEPSLRLLREFLVEPTHRAVLLPEFAAALARVPEAGAMLSMIRGALRP